MLLVRAKAHAQAHISPSERSSTLQQFCGKVFRLRQVEDNDFSGVAKVHGKSVRIPLRRAGSIMQGMGLSHRQLSQTPGRPSVVKGGGKSLKELFFCVNRNQPDKILGHVKAAVAPHNSNSNRGVVRAENVGAVSGRTHKSKVG